MHNLTLIQILAETGGAKEMQVEDIDKDPEERAGGITIYATNIEYETGIDHGNLEFVYLS